MLFFFAMIAKRNSMCFINTLTVCITICGESSPVGNRKIKDWLIDQSDPQISGTLYMEWLLFQILNKIRFIGLYRTSHWYLTVFILFQPIPRTIYHFHYTGWPDHGVPKDPSPVLHILHEVNTRQQSIPMAGPIVVHCRYCKVNSFLYL